MKCLTNLTFALLCFVIFSITPNSADAQNDAIQFDGNDDYITIGNVDFPLEDELTVMAWVKWNIDPSTGNKWANMVTCNASNNGDDGKFWLQHNSNNRKFEFAVKTTQGRKYMFSRTRPLEGVWYHIVATYDGSKMRLYVNGELERTKNHHGDIVEHKSSYVTHIGSWSASLNNYRRFNGDIDKVTIWNVALSTVELNDYACDEIPVSEYGLLAYYDFNEGEGSSDVIDLSGNGNDGEIIDGLRINNDNIICGVLPVSLLDFSADFDKNHVKLNWNTASELNNDFFVVERSEDGQVFKAIGTVTGMGTTNLAQHYDFKDDNPMAGTAYYRLKQVDFNGQFEYHPTVSVFCSAKKDAFIDAYQSEQRSITLVTNIPESLYQLSIVSSAGDAIANIKIPVKQQNQRFIFDLPMLTKGIYFITLSDAKNKFVEKIIMK